MAPKAVKPPATLPADFDKFEKEPASQTLPADFNFGEPPWSEKLQKSFDENSGYAPGEGFVRNAQRGVVSTLTPLMHPIKTGEAIGKSLDSVVQGNPQDAPIVQGVKDTWKNITEDPASGIGQVAGQVLGGAAVGGAVKAATAKPLPSLVTPIEDATLKLSTAVNPAIPDKFISDFPRVAGDVQEYIQRNKQPITRQLDLSKIMDAKGNELKTHYKDQFMEPNKKAIVSVPPDYKGRGMGEGKNLATLEDLNNRVDEINKKLKPDFEKKNPNLTGDEEQALLAEQSKLTDILHKSLSDITGVAPEEIADLRQRGGILKSLAADVRKAHSNRTAAGSGTSAGDSLTSTRSLPLNIARAAKDALEGGKMKAADKRVAAAFKNLPTLEQAPLPVPMKVLKTPDLVPVDRLANAQRQVQRNLTPLQ